MSRSTCTLFFNHIVTSPWLLLKVVKLLFDKTVEKAEPYLKRKVGMMGMDKSRSGRSGDCSPYNIKQKEKLSMGMSIIVNIKLSVQNILFGGGGINGKKVDSIHFQHLSPFFLSFSLQIIHLKNVNVYTF